MDEASNMFGVQNLCKVDNVSSLVESGFPQMENEDSAILIPGSNLCERVHTFSTDVHGRRKLLFGRGVEKDSQTADTEVTVVGPGIGALNTRVIETAVISNKRLRKPTRRYIEEMSEMKSGCHNGSLKTSVISSTEDFMHCRASQQHSFEGDVPFVYQKYHVRSDHPRKITSIAGTDEEVNMLHSFSPKRSFSPQHSESESLDDISDEFATEIKTKKTGIRRKHHRQWTLPEVVKLVNGVSLYGVGRWSEIKRQLFPTSAYRTSVDLKDKWRNLLKASVVQLHEMNKVCASPPIPHSILQRVREISVIHPSYPREQKLSLPQTAASTSPSTRTTRTNTKPINYHAEAVYRSSD